MGDPNYFRFQLRQCFSIDNADSLAAFWQVAHWDKLTPPDLPDIDFNRSVLIVATAGWTGGCTSVVPDSFEVTNQSLLAFITVWRPLDCGLSCQYSFSRPWGAVVIPVPGQDIEPRWTNAYRRCS